jgi:hypothetical protein
VTVEQLAEKYGWDASGKGPDGEPGPSPSQHLSDYIGLLEADLDGIDAVLGLRGEGRTRFYGDRLVRVQSLLRELEAYRNAARAARFVR